MGEEKEENVVSISACERRDSDEMEKLFSEKNQVPDVQDQVCECRKEAVNARGNLSRQYTEEKYIKERREVMREKEKSTCGNMKSWFASRMDGTRTTRTSEPINSTYSCTCEIEKEKKNKKIFVYEKVSQF